MGLLTDAQLACLASDQSALAQQPRSVRKEVAALDSMIGTASRTGIAKATAATAFVICRQYDPTLQTDQIRGHKILATGELLTTTQLLRLQSLVLQSQHHTATTHEAFKSQLDAEPEIAIRFHSPANLSILLDFNRSVWLIRQNYAWPTSTFEPIRFKLMNLVAELVPNAAAG